MLRYTWGFTVTALVLVVGAIWHISLLWVYRDRPSVLGWWLLTALALVLVGRLLARHVAPDARGALMRVFARLDANGVVFVAFLLLLLLLFHVGFERAGSDGRAYFLQVRSLIMDGDFDFTNDEAVFGGRGASTYASGAPVLWSPFFVLGHLWLLMLKGLGLGDAIRADGYTYPYQRAIGLGTLLYGFAGLVLIYRVLRTYFSKHIATLSTLGICGTTALIWYLTVDNSMVHGVSMFATTLFLFLWHRFRTAPTGLQWMWMGAAAGLMTMARWQNAVFVVLPVADLLLTSWRAGDGPTRDRLMAAGRHLALFGAAGTVAFAPQMVFWKSVYGAWIYLPTQEHGFQPGLIPPFITDVLFSPNRGLLSWTPVVTVALVGLVVFARRHWRVALVLAGGFIGQVWVNGAVEIWWGGTGFGARRFANSTLVFAVGLAALLSLAQRRPLVVPAAVLAGLLSFNTLFMLGYRSGRLSPTEGVTFESVMSEIYDRVGNPLSLPMSAYVAWRYDVPLPAYDRVRGRTYNNITIDVGGPDDQRFLGNGWSDREQHPDFSFRWSDADRSTVLVPLKTNVDDYVLELEWAPFVGPDLPHQIVDIDLNGVTVASIAVEPGINADRVEIPADFLRINLNQLRFRYRDAASPQELGMSGDPRRLAVQVNTIRLLRQLGSGDQR